MIKKESRNSMRVSRHERIRKTLVGTSALPRLCVFRSNTGIYAQIIDDETRTTLVSASSLEKDLKLKNGSNVEAAKVVGKAIAEKATKAKIFAVEKDIEAVKSNPVDEKQHFAPMTIGNVTFTVEEKKEAAELLLTKITKEHDIESRKIGSYRGFDIFCQYNIAVGVEMVTLYSPVSGFSYRIELGDNALGNITRLNNSIDSLPKQRDRFQAHLEEVEKNLETAKSQLDKPFEKEAEYQEVSKRLRELNAKLSVEGAKGLENIA